MGRHDRSQERSSTTSGVLTSMQGQGPLLSQLLRGLMLPLEAQNRATCIGCIVSLLMGLAAGRGIHTDAEAKGGNVHEYQANVASLVVWTPQG